MADLKLPKLPDRTPVKLTIVIGSELNEALKAYADRYAQAYGAREPVVELIPFILEAFLVSDKAGGRPGRR
ncbi:DUF2274 domain-containing protein [Asticcacaulis machinosus]|uniref:DUF2274 domain-containing protein n=1 Tax=Asticcacaulis machinosus TaxID=2984211 RepID=A0ABT5HG36_9CAUL|nr:DUF2274 domain-containing protein [Asticcacaulis machinosus]MDC7675147.1 DUF2274 domain-containing protein [Asticcacaulis machinosus]